MQILLNLLISVPKNMLQENTPGNFSKATYCLSKFWLWVWETSDKLYIGSQSGSRLQAAGQYSILIADFSHVTWLYVLSKSVNVVKSKLSNEPAPALGVGVQVTMCYITSDIPALLLCWCRHLSSQNLIVTQWCVLTTARDCGCSAE